MRENMGLYHGKRSDNGKWVEGYFFETNTPVYRAFIITNMSVDITDGCTDILDFNIVEVDPETVGQFAGLTDKNGKKIFEGDIVDCWSEGINAQGVVQQRIDGLWIIYPAWQKSTFWGLCPSSDGSTSVEIIGNIHDNPEVLKGGGSND